MTVPQNSGKEVISRKETGTRHWKKRDEMKEPKRHPPHTSTGPPDSRKGWNWSPGSRSPSLQPLCRPHVPVSLHFLVLPSLLTELLGFTHLLRNGRLSLQCLPRRQPRISAPQFQFSRREALIVLAPLV